ncbi:phosphatase (plasmid) [Brevibacillus laterosporus]|uniref:macro domain-containing protein n=1 Tax=Brevibacillus laterosporus TaxID=1465 RepID=UPI000E6BDCAF|nr:macro domain-containing protein [Brevibacillus laterosporus]AYB41756.1 phosphatase [Brevibacillus laterosporus]
MNLIYKDITQLEVDIIVNASNGIGFMGGYIGRYIKFSGVAESIHYETQGEVEKEAKRAARKKKWLPRYLAGHHAGEVFLTGAANLKASWIIHAVTMPYPGMKAKLDTIEHLLPQILILARRLKAKSIALPLLGTGIGGLAQEAVLLLYKECLSSIKDLEVYVVFFR